MAAQPEFRRAQEGASAPRLVERTTSEPRGRRRTTFAAILAAAALFSLGAGVIHAATVRDEFATSTLYGVTFVAFAVGQIGWALLATAFPSKPIAILGILGNAAVFVIWILTRTTGAPLGPAAGAVLPVGFPDAVATTLEGVTVAAGLIALRHARRDRATSAGVRTATIAAAAAVAVPLATLAVLSQTGVLPALVPST